MHAYMDDFPMAAPTHQQALDKLQQFCTIMHEAGITENKAKRELPFQRGAVLGVGFDTVQFTVHMPQEKVQRATELLMKTASSQCVTLRHLQSQNGLLQHTCWALPKLAAALLLPLLNATRGLSKPFHKRKVSSKLALACVEFADFLVEWNGYSPINDYLRPMTHPLHTDASGGAAGGGAYFQAGRQHHYSRHTRKQRKAPIAYLELYAVYIALLREGSRWRGAIVPVLCDNQTIVQVLKKGRSSSANINDLLRKVLLHCLHLDIVLDVYWISTHDNEIADALSRFQLEKAGQWIRSWQSYSRERLQLAITWTPPSRTTPRRR